MGKAASASQQDGVSVLAVDGLSKAYGALQAVDEVSFALAPGEIAALIGPNGAGKSTLFDMLTGRRRADSGVVRLEGWRLDRLTPRAIARAGVARTFQVTATYPSMTVVENVQIALIAKAGRVFSLLPLATRLYRDEALALLADVGLAAQAARPAAVLAHGDLKRLELAIALAGAPRLLLMDEPTAGMAPAERGQLMALVAARVAAGGLTVLFTEHDMDTVFAHASRVLVMDRGRLIADGPPATVRADPAVRAVYLGEAAAC